jgi:hypothetical protein
LDAGERQSSAGRRATDSAASVVAGRLAGDAGRLGRFRLVVEVTGDRILDGT